MTQQGFFPRLWTRLFGAKTVRLTEELRAAHWLSYLLVLTQSAAAVLVLGHSELPLLFGSSGWVIQAIVALAVFVLAATVYAADMCLLATLKRISVLARNRSSAALWEHVLYVLFVLLVEGSTYAVVMATLDQNPQALLSPAPLFPNDGWLFAAQIGLRAVLVCWTTLQLYIVRRKLPPQLTTLLGKGKEIVGGHVEQQLSALDMSGANLAAAFQLYAAMSRAPRRASRWWNGWLVRLEDHHEREEERQTGLVVEALQSFDTARTTDDARSTSGISQTTQLALPPAAVPNKGGEKKPRQKQEPMIRLVDPDKPVRKGRSPKERVYNVLNRTPEASIAEIAKRGKCAPSTAVKHRRTWLAEHETEPLAV